MVKINRKNSIVNVVFFGNFSWKNRIRKTKGRKKNCFSFDKLYKYPKKISLSISGFIAKNTIPRKSINYWKDNVRIFLTTSLKREWTKNPYIKIKAHTKKGKYNPNAQPLQGLRTVRSGFSQDSLMKPGWSSYNQIQVETAITKETPRIMYDLEIK